MIHNRPIWHEYFFNLCQTVSQRATCLRRQNGAILVKNKHIIATGYNGPVCHSEHCEKCFREIKNIPSGQNHELCFAVHSEQNCLVQCSFFGTPTKNAVCYTIYSPCAICYKLLYQAGIGNIYYLREYPDPLIPDLLRKTEKTTLKLNYTDITGTLVNFYAITNLTKNVFSLGD